LGKASPPAAACRDLASWWERDAPSLAFATPAGPASITGWLPGDLLQHLSDTRRARHALVQTPWWVCDLILDGTLLPAAAELRASPLRVIDPCCGTGHFLVRAIGCLWEWYTTGSLAPRSRRGAQPATGGTPLPPGEAAAMILRGLHGCDKDPLTAAVARLRYAVTLAELMHRAGLISGPLRLNRIPQFQVPVVPGDSLLAGTMTAGEYAEIHPGLAAIVNLGRRHDTEPVTPRKALAMHEPITVTSATGVPGTDSAALEHDGEGEGTAAAAEQAGYYRPPGVPAAAPACSWRAGD
jgi:hypothetical protein